MGTNRQNFLAVVLVSILSISANAIAKDFGVVGHTYKIEEQDIIVFIKERLEGIDTIKLQEEYQQKIKGSVNRPKAVMSIVNATENKEYYYDPTFILKEDISDHQGKLIYKAGTKINPLEKVALSSDLIFINGDNLKQVEFALKHYSAKASKAKIVLVKGSPIKLQKEHKIWIYFDQNGILTSKFGIEQVPAIVTQDKLRLKISEVVL